jgi:amidase
METAKPINLLTETANELQHLLSADKPSINSNVLVRLYLAQIKSHDNYLRAVISRAPEDIVLKRADELDKERAAGQVRSRLHGIPVILKDNVATTADLGLDTTAGCLALVNSKPKENATIVKRVWHWLVAFPRVLCLALLSN